MNIELLKARMKQFFADVDPDALIKKYEEMGYKLVPIAAETPSEPDSEAVEFAEWIGKQGYKLSHYAAKGEAVYLHESKGSVPFNELKSPDWLTTKELYQIFKSQA